VEVECAAGAVVPDGLVEVATVDFSELPASDTCEISKES
jgi:hypothetical protein